MPVIHTPCLCTRCKPSEELSIYKLIEFNRFQKVTVDVYAHDFKLNRTTAIWLSDWHNTSIHREIERLALEENPHLEGPLRMIQVHLVQVDEFGGYSTYLQFCDLSNHHEGYHSVWYGLIDGTWECTAGPGQGGATQERRMICSAVKPAAQR